MSKYRPLTAFLKDKTAHQLSLTFAEVEKVLGFKLPLSAYEHPAWWANDTGQSHAQAKAWLSAGYATEQVNRKAKKLVFTRIGKSPAHFGLAETQRKFQAAEKSVAEGIARHPLIGAMKGTFTIQLGWDLTKPAMDPEELEEMDANLERTANLIEKGLSGAHK